jgi:hypothetical protein
MSQNLKDLLARIEGAAGEDRTLDVRLVAKIRQVGEWSDADIEYACTDPDRICYPPKYTASIDVALGLVEYTLPGWHWLIRNWEGDQSFANIHAPGTSPNEGDPYFDFIAPTAPLAILGSLLKALLASQPADQTRQGGDIPSTTRPQE